MLLASASVSAHHVTASLAPAFIIIIIIHEFHRDASLEQNFRAAKRYERLSMQFQVVLPLSILIAVEISSRLLLLNENSFAF